MIVHVHVDRLVVEGPGLRPADGRRVADALTRELTRLLAAGDLGPGLRTARAEPRVDAPPVAAAAWSSPAGLGRDAARSIHRGLS